MPNIPKRPCCVSGCTNYAEPGQGRCKTHSRPKISEYREKTNALYKTARWQAMRQKQLAREPLCRSCMSAGKITAASEVDHIVPHKGNERLFYDAGNLQSLCHGCHSTKTARENGGFRRAW